MTQIFGDTTPYVQHTHRTLYGILELAFPTYSTGASSRQLPAHGQWGVRSKQRLFEKGGGERGGSAGCVLDLTDSG